MQALPLPAPVEVRPATAAAPARQPGFAAGHVERLRVLNDMVARVSEQISSPLPAPLADAIEVPAEAGPPLDHALLGRLQHLESLVRQLLVCVRGERGERRPLALVPWFAGLGGALAARVEADGGSLELRCVLDEATVLADSEALLTAVQAMLDAWPRCARGYRVLLLLAGAEDGACELVLARHGTDDRPAGPPGATVPTLGAAAARIIARAHGGSLDERHDADGVRLVLRLPRAA